MDPLFNGPASERRRFLDRLVLAVDAAAFQPRLRARALAALAQPAAGRRTAAIRIGSTRSSTRPPRSRSRSRPRAPRRSSRLPARSPRRATQAPAFPLAEIALDGWMEKLLPDHSAIEIEDRYRALLQGQSRARRRRRPHARRPASVRSCRHPCRQGHSGRRRLDRRAEGAADPAGARACRADQGDDRLCAAAAARRSRRPSRSGAARGALRRAGATRRAGLDDRRRSGRPSAILSAARRFSRCAPVRWNRARKVPLTSARSINRELVMLHTGTIARAVLSLHIPMQRTSGTASGNGNGSACERKRPSIE